MSDSKIEYPVLVVGGDSVGLALGAELCRLGTQCLVVEQTDGPLKQVADAVGLFLMVAHFAETQIRDLHEHALVLVRPDRCLAWRGDELPDDPAALIDQVCGEPAT